MAANKYGIRIATSYDLFALERLMAKGIEESQGLLPDYDQQHFFHTALKLIEMSLVFVACEFSDKMFKIVGCLALDGRHYAWNPRVVVLESVHYYVLPEARAATLEDGKTLLWDALLQAGKTLAEVRSTVFLNDGSKQFHPVPLRIDNFFRIDDARAAAKDELMKRAGFSYIGGNHLFIPPTPDWASQKAA
jgi:hypothetical protein